MSGTALYMYKRPDGGMYPADADTQEYVKKLSIGEVIESKVRKARNYKFLKKFFALLKTGFDCQEKYTVFEAFRAEVLIRCGWFETHVHLDSSVSLIPKSIAFDNMDELEFEKVYQAAIDVILQQFVSHMTADDLRYAASEEIARFAG